MKRICCFGLLWAGLAVGCNPDRAQDAEAGKSPVNPAELEQTLQATTDDWNQGNLEAFVAPYDSSSTYMTRTGPVGKTSMLEQYRKSYFANGKPVQNLRFDQVTVRPLGSDHALMTGQYLLAGGNQPDRSGWFSLVWLRTTDGWKILHDHSS